MATISEIMPLEYDDYGEVARPNNLICGTGLLPDCNVISFSHLNILSAHIIAKAAYAMYGENKAVKSEEFTPLYSQEFIPKTAVKKFILK